jgi:hypothetical protein
MFYFLFLFIQVYNVVRLFSILLVLELFLVILEAASCLLLLVKTLRLLDMLRLITVTAKTSISLRNPLFL